jgi:ubiquinone/menaquinone biosynthesis C-methylase UbiE
MHNSPQPVPAPFLKRAVGWLKGAHRRRAYVPAGADPGSRILGRVDAPTPNQGLAGWIDVRGWALSTAGDSVKVEIIIDGIPFPPAKGGLARPDVHNALPSVPTAQASGFEARVLRTDLPERAKHVIEVVAAASGRFPERCVLAKIPVVRESPVVPHSRGNYKQVWDREANTLGHAHHAVCGTDDAAEYERSGEATAADIIAEAVVGPTDTVFEIGCGTGRVGAKLAPKCGRWIGADISANMLSHARKAIGNLPNVSFVELRGADLFGVDDRSVDVIYCTGVFMHLDEWDRYRYVQEGYRVLRPGGRIYYDNFSLLSEEGWKVFQLSAQHDSAARPANISKSSTPEELRTYAQRAGFADIRTREGTLWVTIFARKP